MRQIRLGRTDAQVPAISLGTWAYGGLNTVGDRSVGWTGHEQGQARQALTRACELGITHWDTADVYGDGRSEQLIGSVWTDVAREAIFLASKVGWDPGDHGHFYHPAQIRKQLERSLVNLKTEVIDLYYLHHCDFGPQGEYLDDALALMHRFRDEGKVRFLGLSDWDSSKIMRYIARVDPDVVQPYRNVTHDTYVSSGLQDWVEKRDVGVAFFSPIRHGLLLGKYEKPVSFPEGDFRGGDRAFADQAVLDRLLANRDRVCERFAHLSQPLLNALLGVLLADAHAGCVLLGQRNPSQVEAAAAAAEALTPEEVAWIWELYRDSVP